MFIGVDIGTTRTKALLYHPRTGERIVVAEPTPVMLTPLGDFRDAQAVVATVLTCIARLVENVSPDERNLIGGIGITSLSEEMVLLDAAGDSIAPMPAWYTTVASDAARDRGLDPSFSWSKLRWAFEHVGAHDIRGVTTLNSYVASALSDSPVFAIDHSHASRTGFFDVRAAEWQTATFEATGWPAELLPALVPAGSVVSGLRHELAERWGVPDTASIVLAGHDHFCGAYAVGVRAEGQLYVSAGTSEAHCLIVDALPSHQAPGPVGVGRFVDGEHFYLHRQLPSGHLYRHWTELLGLADAASHGSETQDLEAQPIGALGTTIVPGFDTDTRSSVFDLAPEATRQTLMQALHEGIACAALHVDRELLQFAGTPITGVVAAGIPCASPYWQQLRGNLTIAPLEVSTEEEAPALGAALLCRRAVTGVDTAPSAFRAVPLDAARAGDYEALFARFERKLASQPA